MTGLEVIFGTTVAAYLVVTVTVLLWIRKELAAWKVRVGAVTWTRRVIYAPEEGFEHSVPEIGIDLFNGLPVDVGLHRLILDLVDREGRGKPISISLTDELPETLKAQHSKTIWISSQTIYDLRTAIDEEPTTPHLYRVRLRLGNRTDINTGWQPLPELTKASSPGGGAESDF